MRFKKPVISGLLVFVLLINLLVPAFAYNSQGSNTDLENLEGIDEAQDGMATQYYEPLENPSSASTDVYTTRASTFTALIPKTIILDGITGTAQYVVGAKGDVLDADSITIEPDSDELTLYKKGDASKTVSAGIDQPNTVITGANIEEDVYSTLQGSIQAQGLKAGSWNGQMSFNITLTQTNVPAHKHTLTHVEAVEATEEAPGNIEYWHCTDCDKYYRDAGCTDEITLADTIIQKKGHSFIHVPASAATADHPAIKEHWYCENCGKYYGDANGTTEISESGIYKISNKLLVTKDNRAIITYKGTANEALVIPATFKDANGTWYKVVGIGSAAFKDCTNLASVVIPDSVTKIGYGAFGDCSSLTSIVIPDSVTYIGDYAFENCTGLTSITIPDSIKTIHDSTFSGCTGLTSINIPDSVTSIGEYAFSNVPQVIYDGDATGSPWGALRVDKSDGTVRYPVT